MGNVKEYLNAMVEQYAETLLWTSTEDDVNGETHELDDLYDLGDISDAAWMDMNRDCANFLEMVWRDVPASQDRFPSDMGHNFALSRNGHGTGFWDRGWGAEGDALHAYAKTYGEQNMYSGDDRKLYVA